ncbi:hypothetical protein Csa_006208 [Cucumis sativus]|uniref:Uncharacterized protein n=1 Tax=Cucumis sativus TaxID=3659 RepID=A0A0A0LLJ3_CUCSA|nr:hypothetical protein Csa_006208 [Cucumis sativus]
MGALSRRSTPSMSNAMPNVGRGRDRDEDVGSGNNGNDEKKKMEWFGVGLQEKGGGVVREMKSERLGLKL